MFCAARVVAPEDIGFAVVVQVADRLDLPIRISDRRQER